MASTSDTPLVAICQLSRQIARKASAGSWVHGSLDAARASTDHADHDDEAGTRMNPMVDWIAAHALLLWALLLMLTLLGADLAWRRRVIWRRRANDCFLLSPITFSFEKSFTLSRLITMLLSRPSEIGKVSFVVVGSRLA